MVHSASLESLLQRLTVVGYSGMAFINTFLAMFPVFTDAHTVMDFLISSWHQCLKSQPHSQSMFSFAESMSNSLFTEMLCLLLSFSVKGTEWPIVFLITFVCYFIPFINCCWEESVSYRNPLCPKALGIQTLLCECPQWAYMCITSYSKSLVQCTMQNPYIVYFFDAMGTYECNPPRIYVSVFIELFTMTKHFYWCVYKTSHCCYQFCMHCVMEVVLMLFFFTIAFWRW